MKILVPLDGSELAEYAVGNAAAIARGMPEPATLLFARLVPLSPMAITGLEPSTTHIIHEARTAAEDYLRAVSYRPSLTKILCEQVVEPATISASDWITQVAQEYHCDLIAMSSHGRGGLARAVLGSTAADVARHATIPTLIFRPNAILNEGTEQADHPFTVLVPLDGSPLAEQVLPIAALVAKALEGHLCLLHVLPRASGSASVDGEQMVAADAYLIPLSERYSQAGVPTTYRLAFGDPAGQITEQAQEGSCDLIALATHGRSGVRQWFVGSVTTWVLDHTKLPLLIVRPTSA